MFSETRERALLSRVFFNMTWALALTALVAYGVASYPPLINAITTKPFSLVILLIFELILVWNLSRRIMTLSVTAAYTGFIVYALINGVTISLIFIVYELSSIFIVFAVAAAMFLAMGLFGYFTRADLSGLGRFFLMSLFGLIIASVANFFLRSSTLDYLVSWAGVLIFAGLTAYDMQYLKKLFASNAMSDEENHKLSILGALKLYLDFINLFLWLLRIFGRRR